MISNEELLQRIEVLERHMLLARDLPKSYCQECGPYLPDVDGAHRRENHGYQIQVDNEKEKLNCRFCEKEIQIYETYQHWAGECLR